jgi:hypothetical protein
MGVPHGWEVELDRRIFPRGRYALQTKTQGRGVTLESHVYGFAGQALCLTFEQFFDGTGGCMSRSFRLAGIALSKFASIIGVRILSVFTCQITPITEATAMRLCEPRDRRATPSAFPQMSRIDGYELGAGNSSVPLVDKDVPILGTEEDEKHTISFHVWEHPIPILGMTFIFSFQYLLRCCSNFWIGVLFFRDTRMGCSQQPSGQGNRNFRANLDKACGPRVFLSLARAFP